MTRRMVDHPVRVKAKGFGPLDETNKPRPIRSRSSVDAEARPTTADFNPWMRDHIDDAITITHLPRRIGGGTYYRAFVASCQ